jgi:Hint domain
MTTITANSTIGITLTSPSYNNPVFVEPGVTIYSTRNGVVATSGSWTIQNGGTITGGTLASYATSNSGISLHAGGSVTNQIGGVIAGGYFGVNISGAIGTIINGGTIEALGSIDHAYPKGIYLGKGGTVTNLSTGTISSSFEGIRDGFGGPVAVTNSGLIYGYYAAALELGGGSVITNLGGGTISAGATGASAIDFFGSGTVVNSGVIVGHSRGFGFSLDGGAVTNLSTGTISGVRGVELFAYGRPSVVNYGTINAGVYFTGSGDLANLSGATISGAVIDQSLIGPTRYGVTLTNAGVISSAVTLLHKFLGGATVDNQVIIDPGGTFGSEVWGGSGRLELASGTSAGTLSGLGSQFYYFSQVTLDAGASWTLASTNTIAVGTTFTGAGTLTDAGTLTNQGSLGSPVTLASGAILSNASGGTIALTGTVVVGASTATVVNAGRIVGNGSGNNGVSLGDNSLVINQAGASIYGNFTGVFTSVAPNTTIQNYGLINAGIGVLMQSGGGGHLTNAAGGTIAGNPFLYGVIVNGGNGTVVNAGSITGYWGIRFRGSSTDIMDNLPGGVVAGSHYGIQFTENSFGTIVDAGSISGGTDAVQFAAVAGNRLIVDPGAAFAGRVDGGNTLGATAASTLELASGASAGTLNGLGASIVHFADIEVDTGALWRLQGDALGAGYGIDVAGTLVNQSGSLGSVVMLAAGASFRNLVGATVSSGANARQGVVYGTGTGVTIINNGTVTDTGSSGDGIALMHGGTITNGAIATLIGYSTGVFVTAAVGVVTNSGTILGNYGVALHNGGTITNLAGLIEGVTGVVILGGGATVQNSGTIVGSLYSAVTLSDGGGVSNVAGAIIDGHRTGIAVAGAPATVSNGGLIEGTWVPSGEFYGSIPTVAGISLAAGGSVTNLAGGLVTATNYAIYGGQVLTVVNQGDVGSTGEGDNSIGIWLEHGGAVYNSGVIRGDGSAILDNFSTASVANSGTISAFGSIFADGVHLSFGGEVTNSAGGLIDAPNGTIGRGVVLNGGMLINAGTISGTEDAVYFFPGSMDDLVVEPGAVFIGTVNGGNTIGSTVSSTMELASGASVGTVSGIGSQFIDFANIQLDAGAAWIVNGAVLSGETISFSSGADLQFATPSSVAGSVGNFAPGETIDLVGVDPNSVSFASGTLSFAGGSFPLSFTGGTIQAAASGDGAAVTVTCFREDTHIATMCGEIAVEKLLIGDQVLRACGELADITWIGHRRIDCTRHPAPYTTWPVRISAGAFGNGRPKRDLWLSPDHAVFVDGVLIPVKCLINGRTIVQVPLADVTYFHVELSRHDVLLAEGLPVESYLDTGDRSNFENGGALLTLHPHFATRTWEAHGCAPLVVAGPALDAARAMLNAIAIKRRSAA